MITDRGVVTAGALVIATNTPVNDRVTIHTKQAAIARSSSALGCRTAACRNCCCGIRRNRTITSAFRPPDGGNAHDVLIVGGEDHKTGRRTMPRRVSHGSKRGRASDFRRSKRSITDGPGK